MKAHAREKFRISEFINPSGEAVFRVAGMKTDGTRVRQNFPTKPEALARKQELETEAENLPRADKLRFTRLTDEQLRDAEAAVKEMGQKPLMVAVRYYNQHFREPVKQKPIQEAFELFLADKKAQGLRPDSIEGNLDPKIRPLVSRYEGRMVSDISLEAVKEYIFIPGRGPATKDNYRRALHGFFAWATEHQYCSENPVSKVKPIKGDETDPEVLPMAAIRRLLAAALSYKDGKMVPYLTLSLFCGIRPDKEMKRITWSHIQLDKGCIRLDGKVAKMRGKRVVEFASLLNNDGRAVGEANIIAWLRPHALKRTPLKGVNWRRDFDKVKELAGYGTPSEEKPNLKPWPVDVMRHTAISHHLAYFSHEGRTATWAGNSPDIIQKHYKGMVDRKEAEEFWSLTPASVAHNVVRMDSVSAAA